jgi:hypothetical protein
MVYVAAPQLDLHSLSEHVAPHLPSAVGAAC